jgi:LysM repeat protein
MARVIVVLTLLVLITSGIFYLTRQGAGPSGGDGRTTVELPSGASAEGRSVLIPSSAQDVVGSPAAGAAPAVATVGIDRTGLASLTGTAAPGNSVEVLRDGKRLGESLAGKDGSWTAAVKVPTVQKPFSLVVRSKSDGSDYVEGPQRILVSPPERAGGLPILRIVAAEDAGDALSVNAASGASPEPTVGIIIEGVDADEGGEVRLSGRADPGTTVRLEMAGVRAGSSRVGDDGRWLLTARNKTGVEVKSVRVVLETEAGVQLDASLLPLRLPALATVASASNADSVRSGAARPARGGWIKVRRGDSLWKLARRHYGDGAQWTRILKANRKRIRNPDLIMTGWRLRLP